MSDYLSTIVARKRLENERRRRHLRSMAPVERQPEPSRGRAGVEALRRDPGGPPSVMAEVKFRSPSAGVIREKRAGEALRVAQAYERGGASVISVLADGPGFAGSPLVVRRVAERVRVPVLFKEFVLDPIQVELAYDVGASLVLLLVRCLTQEEMTELMARTRALGMEPVVEAASAPEVDRAIDAGASIIGVNARDLSTFRVDMDAAADYVERIPEETVGVFMSGVRTADDFRIVAQGPADAVLIGEGLMRAEDPGARLAELLRSV